MLCRCALAWHWCGSPEKMRPQCARRSRGLTEPVHTVAEPPSRPQPAPSRVGAPTGGRRARLSPETREREAEPLPSAPSCHHVPAGGGLWVCGAPAAKVATPRSSASRDPGGGGRTVSQRGCDSA